LNLNLPNLLSLLRMGLVPIFVIAITRGETGEALAIFLIAGVTDALDGFIARFRGQQTTLGTFLDPAADKLLLTAGYVVLTIDRLTPELTIPLWVTILVIARDVLIVVTAAALYAAQEVRSFPPTFLSKVTTAVQVLALALVLLANTLVEPGVVSRVAEWTVYAVAVFTVASGVGYVLRAGRMDREGQGA
jgi:cardiolipin synthase